jgi:two-component system, OmpR family, KDP operon response regulator KdpE
MKKRMRPTVVRTDTGKILVVAKDAGLRSCLRRSLDQLCFDVGEALDGASALTRLCMVDYEAVIIECVTFETDSLAVCEQLRSSYPRLPILIVTAQNNLDHKIAAFEAGVDDFITRPVHERELAARLRSAIRRSRAPFVPTPHSLTIGQVYLDPAQRRVEKSGVAVSLTPIEFSLLEFLMQQSGRAVPHSVIASTLWGEANEAHRKHLRVVVGSMRGKIEDDPSNPKYLITHSYFGYSFRSP